MDRDIPPICHRFRRLGLCRHAGRRSCWPRAGFRVRVGGAAARSCGAPQAARRRRADRADPGQCAQRRLDRARPCAARASSSTSSRSAISAATSGSAPSMSTGAADVAKAAKAAGVDDADPHVDARRRRRVARAPLPARGPMGEAAVREALPERDHRPAVADLRAGRRASSTLMASLSRFFPVMPLIGGKSKFQPVYVGDVAAAVRAGGGGRGEAGPDL